MKSGQRKTVLVRVQFPDRSLAKLALLEFGRDPALLVNVLRGRITQKDASFELEVTGRERCIEKFLQQSDTLSVLAG